MKKVFIVFFLLGLYSVSFAGFGGDSLGSHKATRDLDMDSNDIDEVDEVKVETEIEHYNDPNTKIIFTVDGMSLMVGSFTGIRLQELVANSRIFIGGGNWQYINFGCTTTVCAMMEISTYTFASYLWSLRNVDVFFGVKATTGTFKLVETTTISARDGDGTWFRNDGLTGGFNLHDDGSMDAKGSWNMEGHDVNGADDIAGQSLSITGEYSIGGADGNDGDVLTTDGAGGVTLEAPAGGGGGNKTREEIKMAESFSTAGNSNNAAIVLKQFQTTYNGVVSTSAVYYIKCPDSDRPNHAFTSMNWSREWDDGTVYVYVNFKTSSTSDSNVWTEIGISTCPFVGDSFEIYEATTTAGSGWCDQRTATFTIATTSVLYDGKDVTVHLGRGRSDPCAQTIYYKSNNFTYGVD